MKTRSKVRSPLAKRITNLMREKTGQICAERRQEAFIVEEIVPEFPDQPPIVLILIMGWSRAKDLVYFPGQVHFTQVQPGGVLKT